MTTTPLPTLDELLDQEARLTLPSLSEDDAIAIGQRTWRGRRSATCR